VSLPEGFSLRSARDEDAERAAELVNEEARVHLGTPIWSTDQVLRHWSNPVVDRKRDVAVVEAPGGEICAWFSLVCGPPHVEVFALGVVGLAWHGRGVGAWILAETERRAHRFLELAPAGTRVVIHAGALADEPAVGALLAAAGYREIRRFQLMRGDFAGVPAGPERARRHPHRAV
jgi:GNAT superfamily N-acetyltransferase